MRLAWISLAVIPFSCGVTRDYEPVRDNTPQGGEAGAGGEPTTPCPSCAGEAGGGNHGGGNSQGGSAGQGGFIEGGSTGGSPVCTGCSIDSACVPAGKRNPLNECERCDPDTDDAGWTSDDGHSCDDGLFCTTNDTCKRGSCEGTDRQCEDGVACNGVSTCDEDEDLCTEGQTTCTNAICDVEGDRCVPTCDGCLIASQCVPAGHESLNNPCLVCDPTVSKTDYGPKLGKTCGKGAETCSKQDTCDAQGVCQPNHEADGKACAMGECMSGVCEILQSPFDCIVPDPPEAILPDELYGPTGSPPDASGGAIVDGKYLPIRLDIYGPATTVNVRTFEVSKHFVQIGQRPFSPETGGAWIPQVEFAGTFTTSGSEVTFMLERCDPAYNLDVPKLAYTTSANGMITYETHTDGTVVATRYARQ